MLIISEHLRKGWFFSTLLLLKIEHYINLDSYETTLYGDEKFESSISFHISYKLLVLPVPACS
jgi:hypothetical protein